MKFPGRQKVVVSSKFGFTNYEQKDFQRLKDEGKLKVDGANVQPISIHGPLARLGIH